MTQAIDVPSAARPSRLAAPGQSLAAAGSAALSLSRQLALGDAAPDLVSFEPATPEQLARLQEASENLARTIVDFLDAVQPDLVAGTHERMGLARAEAEHTQASAHAAARSCADRAAAGAERCAS